MSRLWVLFTAAFAFLGAVLAKQGADLLVGVGRNDGELSRTERVVRDILHEHRTTGVFIFGFTVVGLMAGWLVASLVFRRIRFVLEDRTHFSFADRLAVVAGVILGVILTALISIAFDTVRKAGVPVTLLLGIVCIGLAVATAGTIKDELLQLFPSLRSTAQRRGAGFARHRAKVLDANIIIDGRIYDICRTGFIEGPVYLPRFILEEVQKIGDSQEETRRARGRRGLETLTAMQKEFPNLVVVYEGEEPEPREGEAVDIRLIRLAREMDADIVTNDFNLHKIAELHGVHVLNVNQLAISLKPVFLPGEEVSVDITRPGTEPEQGVGYLDDGTMVVVEGARSKVGQEVLASVTSVLQTAAGKMIFASIKEGVRPEGDTRLPRAFTAGHRTRRRGTSPPPPA